MAVKHRHRGTRPAQVGTLLAGLALAAGACGSSSTSAPVRGTSSTTTHVSSAPAGRTPTVLLERGTPVGTVLVDAAGHWLYLNHADTAGGVGSFTCSGACLRSWHPLLLPPADLAPVVPRALAGKFAVVQRPGGGQQVAFSGAPLYRWVGPGKPVTTGGWAPAVVPATSGGTGSTGTGSAGAGTTAALRGGHPRRPAVLADAVRAGTRSRRLPCERRARL